MGEPWEHLDLDAVFRSFAGRPAHLVTFPGNNGDKLILLGARRLLARQPMVLVDRPEQADVLVLVGGGMMTGPHGGRDWLARLCRAYPSHDVILLPSSFSAESIAPAFEGSGANAYVFARDPLSLEALRAMRLPDRVRLGLDHDVSLALEDSDLVEDLRSRASVSHILVVERTDVESASGGEFWSFLERPAPRWLRPLPLKLRSAARSALIVPRRLTLPVQMSARARTPYATRALDRVLADLPDLDGLPLLALDIGQTSACSFEAYCRYIAEAAAVFTTRLHVGILSAMLGKPTYIDCGAAKVREVYRYSLARFPHVRPVQFGAPPDL